MRGDKSSEQSWLRETSRRWRVPPADGGDHQFPQQHVPNCPLSQGWWFLPQARNDCSYHRHRLQNLLRDHSHRYGPIYRSILTGLNRNYDPLCNRPDISPCVCVCVVSVIVKRPVLPPCVVDGRSRNPLYYYYIPDVSWQQLKEG